MSFKIVVFVAAVFAYEANAQIVRPFATGFATGLNEVAKPMIQFGQSVRDYVSRVPQMMPFPGQFPFPGPNSNFPGPNPNFPGPNPNFPGPNSNFPGPNPNFPGPNPNFPIPNSNFPGPGPIPQVPKPQFDRFETFGPGMPGASYFQGMNPGFGGVKPQTQFYQIQTQFFKPPRPYPLPPAAEEVPEKYRPSSLLIQPSVEVPKPQAPSTPATLEAPKPEEPATLDAEFDIPTMQRPLPIEEDQQ